MDNVTLARWGRFNMYNYVLYFYPVIHGLASRQQRPCPGGNLTSPVYSSYPAWYVRPRVLPSKSFAGALLCRLTYECKISGSLRNLSRLKDSSNAKRWRTRHDT